MVGVSAGDGGRPRRAAQRGSPGRSRRRWNVELLVPYSEGGRLSELHALAGDLEREDGPEGVLVRARVPAPLVHRFTEFACQRCSCERRPAPATTCPPSPGPRGAPSVAGLFGCGQRRRRVPMRATPASICTRPRPGRSWRRANGISVGTGGRDRDPRGSRGVGAAALRARGPPRHRTGQRPGADRLRLPGRAAGVAAEHRPRRRHSRSAPATGSRSC